MTPDSVISWMRSLPSRLRSPTPGEHRHAGVLLGDVADQLLDDDRLADAGAAEDADLAALLERADQVDDLEAGLEDLDLGRLLVERRRLRGGSGMRSSASTGPLPSIGWPSTSNTRPSVGSPTGHADRATGVARRRIPRARPSVVVMATVRTQLLPRCCWTSQDERVLALALDLDRVVDRRQLPGGNSMSTTGPVIWMTRPVAAVRRLPCCGDASSSPAISEHCAPVAISIISRVMLAWRTLLYVEGQSSMSSSAFSVAFLIATMRLDSSAGLGLEDGLVQARRDVARQEPLEHGTRVRARR